MAWRRGGTLVDSASVANAWGIRRQTVDAARARSELYSLWFKGQHWYLAELLQSERQAVACIHAALGAADPSRKPLFLLHPHGALGGRTASDTAADRLEDVVRPAASWLQDWGRLPTRPLPTPRASGRSSRSMSRAPCA